MTTTTKRNKPNNNKNLNTHSQHFLDKDRCTSLLVLCSAVAALPNKNDAVKDEQVESDDTSPTPKVAADPDQDADNTANAAPASHILRSAPLIMAAIVAITSLTTL